MKPVAIIACCNARACVYVRVFASVYVCAFACEIACMSWRHVNSIHITLFEQFFKVCDLVLTASIVLGPMPTKVLVMVVVMMMVMVMMGRMRMRIRMKMRMMVNYWMIGGGGGGV